MKRRLLVAAAVAVFVLAGLVAFVAVPVAGDLSQARAALSGDLDDLDEAQIVEAREHMESAHFRLDSLAGRIARLIPVVGTNLGAVNDVAATAGPVLGAGLELKTEIEALREEGLLEDGRIRTERLRALAGPLRAQVDALDAFKEALRSGDSGWLAPPVWDALDETLVRAMDVAIDASRLKRLIELVPSLLGEDEPRTYLFVLMNNAELRGAGGLLSGVGTIEVDRGRLSIGQVDPVEALRTEPFQPVDAPDDFEDRFAIYEANTTRWKNTSYSPDFPDVALVASRLYEKVTGVATDGAIGVDPRGLEALMPEGTEIDVPHTNRVVDRESLSRYVYSTAYQDFPGFDQDTQERRREAILEVGKRAVESILQGGDLDDEFLDRVGAALSAGHIRVVSFDEEEQAVLNDLGTTWDLEDPYADDVLVTVQNWGGGGGEGNKLDYWTRRKVEHACDLSDYGSHCETTVTLTNETPDGLDVYVAGEPYGLVRNYLEIYVPDRAELQEVVRDGTPVEFRPEPYKGRRSLGIYVEIPQGGSTTVSARYLLPPLPRYELTLIPQPLTQEADLSVRLAFPRDWTVRGPGEVGQGTFVYEGPFDSIMSVVAAGDQRTGIPGLWDSLGDFFREPLW